MLIIPIQDKPDWSRPPLITLALIVLNILVFLFYQSNDDVKLELAADIYHNHQLDDIERPYYRDYLQEYYPDDVSHWDAQHSNGSPLIHAMFDFEFEQHLREVWVDQSLKIKNLSEWRDSRRAFEQQRNSISSFQAGLIPAESRPFTFMTSMFLHGGWGHLLGNMVFLFLFGFTLERALGAGRFLVGYLLSGIAAGALFIVITPDSLVPLVGASGAISGLMGMYLALYRLRKIRFFYSVLFYFGEFVAPALWVFPVWIAKELYGHFFVDSNTAYWAHIGGLLAGCAIMLALPVSRREFAKTEQQSEQITRLDEQLLQVQALAANLDFNRARSRIRVLCEQYGDDPRPWRLQFNLYKNQPSERAFHEVTFTVLKQFVQLPRPNTVWADSIEEIVQEYRSLAPKAPALTGKLALALAQRFLQLNKKRQAASYSAWAQQKGVAPTTALAALNT
ncbi:rhomboid family intramembrane serine protease [Gilvimarinus polysaccharolyticus]|uniref:rhomboid family intramembrane serine protease n=1 Tax=Gilvimarinus polysaccharolyticus TaxID=863921 RepID=UPI000673BF92|nr:rhomboid family intramembrane serine protease [Gilvimarinus polysaccharolyticus]